MKNRLVAHRGDMKTYPENSLLALNEAAKLGFAYLELDIQLSSDHRPIVIHDDSLLRTTGINKDVKDLTAAQLNTYSILSPKQDQKDLLKISTLEQAVNVLNDYPKITLFVEIKEESIEHFDLQTVVDATTKDLKHAQFNIVIISFMKEVLELVKEIANYPVGWVLRKYDQTHKEIAVKMNPDYIFCNVKKVNQPSKLWQGSWKWALYDVMNPTFAYELLEQGVSLIETGDIVKLSDSEEFC